MCVAQLTTYEHCASLCAHAAAEALYRRCLSNSPLNACRRMLLRAVGNPQQLGQKPLTFNRYVLALCASPELLNNPRASDLFPQDAIDRAKELMGYVGSVGAYSDSRGVPGIRQEVANFIEARDGCGSAFPPATVSSGAAQSKSARTRLYTVPSYLCMPRVQDVRHRLCKQLCAGHCLCACALECTAASGRAGAATRPDHMRHSQIPSQSAHACRHKADPNRIFLTDGASVGVRMCLNALIRDARDAVLVPVPQYPLYSASIALYNGTFEGYLLDEDHGWSMDTQELQKKVDDAEQEGRAVRGLVFINPGNPTGQCLSRDNLEELIKFCVKNKVVLMADEVYQPNIYQDEKPFLSAR